MIPAEIRVAAEARKLRSARAGEGGTKGWGLRVLGMGEFPFARMHVVTLLTSTVSSQWWLPFPGPEECRPD